MTAAQRHHALYMLANYQRTPTEGPCTSDAYHPATSADTPAEMPPVEHSDTMGDGCAHTTLTSADAGTQPKAAKESES